MDDVANGALDVVRERLSGCYANGHCRWERFYRPRWERGNFATRYHLVYPALAYFVLLKDNPAWAPTLRPQLDAMYRGLCDRRCWDYWHTELDEPTWPLQERNLTFAGRLATFVGFYVDAFGELPAREITLDGRETVYSELSTNLWRQAQTSPTHGVTCYHHQAMVMCNAHLLINNILHDRIFGTSYAASNEGWLQTVDAHLVRADPGGALFYFGTESASCAPGPGTSLGMDVWALFLMSGVVPERVRLWFERWKHNITIVDDTAHVGVPDAETKAELSSTPLATAWAFCLARELGEQALATSLRRTLDSHVVDGFVLDPLLSGLYLLGESLAPGAFHRLVVGDGAPR